FAVSVSPTGFYKFDIVQRTAVNTPGTSLASVTTALPYDHKWHRWECRINGATASANLPQILWDNTLITTGTTAGVGRTAVASPSFPTVNNAGPVPTTVPVTLANLAPPVTVTVGPDEFFALAQRMTGATTAAQNIRWDNIKIGSAGNGETNPAPN